MPEINTFAAWITEVRSQNPAMSGETVRLSSDNLEKLLRKTWNLAFEAGKSVNDRSEPGLPPGFENLFRGGLGK